MSRPLRCIRSLPASIEMFAGKKSPTWSVEDPCIAHDTEAFVGVVLASPLWWKFGFMSMRRVACCDVSNVGIEVQVSWASGNSGGVRGGSYRNRMLGSNKLLMGAFLFFLEWYLQVGNGRSKKECYEMYRDLAVRQKQHRQSPS